MTRMLTTMRTRDRNGWYGSHRKSARGRQPRVQEAGGARPEGAAGKGTAGEQGDGPGTRRARTQPVRLTWKT